jgi:hypothetical protein
MRQIRASVETIFQIGWLFLFNAEILKKSHNSLLFSAVVFLPLYINTNYDVGGDAHFIQWPMPTTI